MQTFVMSGRAQTKLMRHQHRVAAQVTALRSLERVLEGTLAACDARTQQEMIASYLESVQELRVQVLRLESVVDGLLARAEALRTSGLASEATPLLASD